MTITVTAITIFRNGTQDGTQVELKVFLKVLLKLNLVSCGLKNINK